jgi:hypothetical protein
MAENCENYIPVIWFSYYRDLDQSGYCGVRSLTLTRDAAGLKNLMPKLSSPSPSLHPHIPLWQEITPKPQKTVQMLVSKEI